MNIIRLKFQIHPYFKITKAEFINWRINETEFWFFIKGSRVDKVGFSKHSKRDLDSHREVKELIGFLKKNKPLTRRRIVRYFRCNRYLYNNITLYGGRLIVGSWIDLINNNEKRFHHLLNQYDRNSICELKNTIRKFLK